MRGDDRPTATAFTDLSEGEVAHGRDVRSPWRCLRYANPIRYSIRSSRDTGEQEDGENGENKAESEPLSPRRWSS
jgi:hypothetical protein